MPTSVNGFTVLPLTLPAQPNVHIPDGFPPPKHYLYIKPHEPSNPTRTAERSLFVSNIPFDASEDSLRKLFATEQLGGSRVEHVEFDSAIPSAPAVKRWKEDTAAAPGSGASASAGAGNTKQGKKRKRDEEIVAEGVMEDAESKLPSIWPGELRKSGSTAVVVFVDRASCKGAWKAVREVVKKGEEVGWEGGAEREGLVGLERMCSFYSTLLKRIGVGFWRLMMLTRVRQVTNNTTPSNTPPNPSSRPR
jgi:ribosomal RNA-processing protein 7